MPFITVKAYPMDEETKRRTAEEILEVFRKTWGAEPDWVTVSMEDVDPDDWDEQVVKGEILPGMDKVMILNGKKLYPDRKP